MTKSITQGAGPPTLQLAIPGIDVTPTGVVGDLTVLADADLGALMAEVDRRMGVLDWALGDLLIEAMARVKSGDGSGIPADAWPSHQPTAARAVQVSLTFPPGQRRAGLTWAHHDLVAHHEHRDRLLDVAEREGLSVSALRAIIRQEAEDTRPQLDGMPPKPWKPPAKLAVELAVLWRDEPDAAVVLRSDGTWGRLRDASGVEMGVGR